METPYYVIHKESLQRNIEDFRSGMLSNWAKSRLAYSVKTNSLPWILRHMKSLDVMAEVVSDEEYELAKLCGFTDTEIIYNGPIKTKGQFFDAINRGAIVNIDSSREIEWIKEINCPRIGLRVNVPPELFHSKDIEYLEDGFRFGFSEEELKHAINTITATNGGVLIGLHLHCNSITRDIEVYRAIARYAVYILDKHDITPEYIDIGGGFFGGVPGKTKPSEYFSVIADELKVSERTKNTILIAEPGSALVGSVIDLVTSVIDVKDTSRARIVTTDGSRIHIDPLWIKNRYMYSIEAEQDASRFEDQIICGYTCMDHDRIMKISNCPELHPGDRIIYHRVGAYSMTFGGPFIRYFPDVYVKDGIEYEKVRRRMSVEDYYNIETC